MDFNQIMQWLVHQGSIVFAYALGVLSSMMFIRKMNQDTKELEYERYNQMREDISNLRLEMKRRDDLCEERMSLLEAKYKAEIAVLRTVTDKSDSRSEDLMKILGQRNEDKRK